MNIVYLSGACVVHNRKTLLLQQPPSGRHPGLWGPPGGHTEKGETPLDCAVREVKEETNLDIKIKGLVASGIKTHSDGRVSVLTIYYAMPTNVDLHGQSPWLSTSRPDGNRDEFSMSSIQPRPKSVDFLNLTLKSLKIDEKEVSDFKWVSESEIRRDSYQLRDHLLKDVLLKALRGEYAAIDTFQIFS